MSQADILKVLKENQNRWMSATDIAKELFKSQAAIINSLKQLRKYGEVLFKFKSRGQQNFSRSYLYKLK